MRICPKCRTAYPTAGRSTCAQDGTRLIDAEEYARSRSDPLLGRTIAGRFHVIERIGTGGMGTVYRAKQSGLDREVALKVLKRELVSDRDTVARFHREAKAMSLLMHPNTVRVFDFGEDDDGYLYLAMELLEGELLTAWIERDGTPALTEAVEIASEILRSLAEAHSKGIVHRDLKPDNIFLARVEGHARPVVKVLDFGIAKAFRDDQKIDQLETQAGTVFGTPRYMSPEQAQGKSLDHRSDLYSVGVLLYHLLTGHAPFVDDDAVVVMAKHIRETPPRPRQAAPERPIPRNLDKVVMRALAKEPDNRYSSADVFEARLAACLPDVEAEARRARGGLAALPRVPLAIGGGIVVVALGIAVAVAFGGSTEEVAEAHVIAAPPQQATAPEREPTPPAHAEQARVTLGSDPTGAAIWRGDELLGTTPRTFEIPDGESMHLTLRAEGHHAADVDLDGETPNREVSLTPLPSTPAPRRAPSAPHRATTPHPRAEQATPSQPEPSHNPYERFD